MNDNDVNDKDDQHDDEERARRHPRVSRKLRLGVAAAGLIGIGVALGSLGAMSLSAGAHMFGGHGGHGGSSVERMTERAKDRTAWVMGKLDASEAQEQQMDALVETLIGDLQPLRSQHVEHRRAFIAELLRSQPDRAKLEGLRQEELRLADLASARVLDAVVQASETLTPEQREELMEFASRHRRRH